MQRNIAVFGILRDRVQLELAVGALKMDGFRPSDLSALLPHNQGARELGHEKHTKAPEGATAGASTGALLGGALGWLVGIGALAIPGLGAFLAAGPIVSALAGAGVGGAVGGLTGALIGLGVPEYEAKRYEGLMRTGHLLLSVHCDDLEWAARARHLLERCGATDISATGEAAADYRARP
jgi:hypothetical protein